MSASAKSSSPPLLAEDAILLDPILHTGPTFYVTVAMLLSVIALGVYAYSVQYREGLGVTGLGRPVYWGFYITNFVFFIGISHAGTLISAAPIACLTSFYSAGWNHRYCGTCAVSRSTSR